MARKTTNDPVSIYSWHRNLLVTGAIFTTFLIAMGGILCMTQSIRNCPDWPGCFGRVVPPAETGPILEYTHRLLAGMSSLLIVSSAVVGMVRTPRLRWISIPPLIALALLVLVSFFGAQVVLRGLSPGWATVDVGSALLVVGLMVTAAVKASTSTNNSARASLPPLKAHYSTFVLATIAVVYIVLVSGILVMGKGSFSGCLGWPIYSLQQFQLDGLGVGNILRLALSVLGIGMLAATIALAWRNRSKRPKVFTAARWVGLTIVLEALLQALLLVFGMQAPLLIAYTIVAAAFWALLVALAARASLQPVSV